MWGVDLVDLKFVVRALEGRMKAMGWVRWC